MSPAVKPRPRPQSLGEEIANSVSHGVALLAAVALLPVLVVAAWQRGDAAQVVGASVFGASAILLFLASTIYHALPEGRAKRVFYVLDHAAIYLLIAGTYTPFTLGVLRGSWGWTLLGLVWGLALVGVLLKSTGRARHPVASTGLYLAMGWLIVIAAGPFLREVPAAGQGWLLAGGLAYTVGVVFFALDRRVSYAHFVWHLFVVAGTACHAVAVMWYAA
jgi:hemolysin III